MRSMSGAGDVAHVVGDVLRIHGQLGECGRQRPRGVGELHGPRLHPRRVGEDRARVGRQDQVQLGLLGEVACELAGAQQQLRWQLVPAPVAGDVAVVGDDEREVGVAVGAGALDLEEVAGGAAAARPRAAGRRAASASRFTRPPAARPRRRAGSSGSRSRPPGARTRSPSRRPRPAPPPRRPRSGRTAAPAPRRAARPACARRPRARPRRRASPSRGRAPRARGPAAAFRAPKVTRPRASSPAEAAETSSDSPV